MRIRQALGAALATAALAVAVAPQAALAAGAGTQEMYRLYNPYTGEHHYTASVEERDHLDGIGWNYEGVGWVAPAKSGTPVYRLYNPYAPGGDHHYTTSSYERDQLVRAGWDYEGVGWYSDDARGVALYRQYNPNARSGTHNYTASKGENDALVRLGWRAEGVGWYGVKASSGGSGSGGSAQPSHEHDWKPVYGTRWVQDEAAWDEPVYETVTTYQCGFCGKKFADTDSDKNFDDFLIHNDTEHESEANYVNKDEKVQVGTVHHDATGHNERYVTGYKCATCGATK